MGAKVTYPKKRRKWNELVDFTGISAIGFLCDNGEIIRGDVIKQKQREVFVHFSKDGGHYGEKYDWIAVPNKRICSPPNKGVDTESIKDEFITNGK
eukprot:148699_1